METVTSVGVNTNVCALSDQVKKYKSKEISTPSTNQDGRKMNPRGSIDAPLCDTLTVSCIKVLTRHFVTSPDLKGIPQKLLPQITERLPVDLDVTITGPHLLDENYWKRCCYARKGWSNLQIMQHGQSWRQLYIERNLQDILETFDIEECTLEHLMAIVSASQDSVFSLTIVQLLSHIDMDTVCSKLLNLTQLHLTYGVKQIGMKYERMIFGMKISDATALSRYLKNSLRLVTLKIPNNLIDDDLLRMLMTGLIKNNTITYLDISHNKITNHGARLLAKLLGPNSVLTTLDLCDNHIHAEGGRYLSRGLRYNTSLVDLNLRLNRLTDSGGRFLIEGLMENTTLQALQLSSNSMGAMTAHALSKYVQLPTCALTRIICTGNDFNEDDVKRLFEGLQHNVNIISFDLRMNACPAGASVLVDCARILRRNEIELRNK